MKNSWLGILVLLFSAVAFAETPATVELGYPESSGKYVPLVILGEGWTQQIIVQNSGDEPVTGTVKFFTSTGEPWRVPLQGRGTNESFFVTLNPGAIAVYETVVSFGGQQLGFAYINLSGYSDTAAQTIYRKQSPGRPDLLTSLPVGSDSLESSHLFFDNRNGNFAGVGILATDSCYSFGCETKFRIRLRDDQGNTFSERIVTRRNQTLWWFSLTAEFPESNGRLGSLEILDGDDSDTYNYTDAVSFALQFTANGAFTAVTSLER